MYRMLTPSPLLIEIDKVNILSNVFYRTPETKRSFKKKNKKKKREIIESQYQFLFKKSYELEKTYKKAS